MLALVNVGPGPEQLELTELELPTPGIGEVVLEVDAVGICGSDVHILHGDVSWPMRHPLVIGHEFAGTIVSTGPDIRSFALGELVVSETAAWIDPQSPYTRTGTYNLDPTRQGFGALKDGAMAEYCLVPERCLHRVPPGMSPELACLAEPAAVAYQTTVVQSRVDPGDVVLVIGPGPIGLLCTWLAARSGGRVVTCGTPRDAARLEIGRALGATAVVASSEEARAEVARLATRRDHDRGPCH